MNDAVVYSRPSSADAFRDRMKVRARNNRKWSRRVLPWLRFAALGAATQEGRQVAGMIAAICSRQDGRVAIRSLRDQAPEWGLVSRLGEGVSDLIRAGYLDWRDEELAIVTPDRRWESS